jgi:molecular chaperone HtpG
MTTEPNNPVPFKAETSQLLNILIHSLYSEREVFLRELISNASDALTRMNFIMLTNRNIQSPELELGIWVNMDPSERILTIRDSGVGMTEIEMVENLGTIAHSGARAFLEAAQQGQASLSDIIGQFGVGFYSAFMVAEWITVESRSYLTAEISCTWHSEGSDTFTLGPADRTERGTVIRIKLKEDAVEFADEQRLRETIKKHSDYVPFPIYLGESKEQVNQQNALWRSPTREIGDEKCHEFYKQLTLDWEPPLTYTHLSADAPVQLYALLFIPATANRTIFSLRKEDGLKLYARKILIQEYCKDLLPEYLRFIQGVVDSEDLPLNVSREMIQSSRLIQQLRRLVTTRVFSMLEELAKKPEDYEKFWHEYGRYLKEGAAVDRDNLEKITPLLRFATSQQPDRLNSLDDYIQSLKPGQKKIYYIVGDDPRSITRSPHLDLFRRRKVDVLLLSDPIDSFVVLSLPKYKNFDLVNASVEKPDVDSESEPENPSEVAMPENELTGLIERFRARLGERVKDVRSTDRLLSSPARLVDEDGALQPEMQRVYRLLKQDYEVPQKILEVNPSHPLLIKLASLAPEDPRSPLVIDQVFENALLIEGLHPDPASMIERLQEIMDAALSH